MARGNIKSTGEVITQILHNSELPVKKFELLRKVGGVGWNRFEDIVEYMLNESTLDIVKIGSEEHLVRRSDANGEGGAGNEN